MLIIMRDQRPAVQAREVIWMQMRLWVWEMRSWRLDRGIGKGDGMRHGLEEQPCRMRSLEFLRFLRGRINLVLRSVVKDVRR
jgi:hypothetical protein